MMMRLLLLALLVAVTVAVPAEQKEGNNGDVMQMIQEMQKASAELKAENKNIMNEMRMVRRERLTFSQKFQKEVTELKAETKELREEKKDLMQEIQNIRDERQMNSQSMFFATISSETISISNFDPIIWDSAPINPGGYFSTVTGGYTAPSNGYYQFSVVKLGNNYNGGYWFLVDDVRIATKDSYSIGSDSTPSGSATISIELTAGQVVRIENADSTVIYGTNSDGIMHSWFTGHLLYVL